MDRRRIPDYRPVNRDLDQNLRRVYLNNVEKAFITMMFLGVGINAVSGSGVWCSWYVRLMSRVGD